MAGAAQRVTQESQSASTAASQLARNLGTAVSEKQKLSNLSTANARYLADEAREQAGITREIERGLTQAGRMNSAAENLNRIMQQGRREAAEFFRSTPNFDPTSQGAFAGLSETERNTGRRA